MESTATVAHDSCESAIILTPDNNTDKGIINNSKKLPQHEKEAEMEVDNPIGIHKTQIMPLIFSNTPQIKPQLQFQLQHYFSLFYKEILGTSSNILCELVLPGSISLQLDLKRLFPTVIIYQEKRSKFSLVELLHTIVILSLGKKSTDVCFNKHLFSAMFKISCESNDAVRNLLQQFTKQIIHYLSSKSMSDTRVAIDFEEILFKCLNCESSSIIKDYISTCIKEFLQSLLNLLPRQDRQNYTIYHHTIHKLINLATYPSYNEPLTAAYAFNHLFNLCVSPYLNMIAPNKYWLEFLHSFLMNLEKCNEQQVFIALRHIKDTISSRTSIFNAKFPSRRKPAEFSNEKLEGAVIWLFEQCANVSTILRCNCMNLFKDLCVHVSNIKSIKDFVDKYGVKNVNKIALESLNDFEHLDLKNLTAFLRTLDFYTWIFTNQMSTPEVIFMVDKSEKEKIPFLNVFGNIISILVSDNFVNTVKATYERDALKILGIVNLIVLRIFSFIKSILIVGKNVKNVIKNAWNDNLCLLVSRFVLCPLKLGFTEQTLMTIKPQFLQTFLNTLSEHLPCAYLTKFQKNFFIETQEKLQHFSNVHQVIALENQLSSMNYFLNGITRLKSYDFINFEKQLKFTDDYIKEKITGIFEVLKSVVVNSNSNVIKYLNGVVNFFLLSYKPELAELIINLIKNEHLSTNGTTNTLFFETFKQPILQFFMKNPVESLNMLNEILLSSPEKFLLLLESLLVYATSNPSDNTKILGDRIIKNCSTYKDLILDVQYHDWLFKIYRQAVRLSSDPTIANEGLFEPLISYVLEEFNKAESAAKRIEIVDGFIRCFIDGTRASKPPITAMFRKLKEERLEAPQQLNALIEKLVAIKSWQIWEGIILLTCGACSDFFKDINLAKHVETYFCGMSSEDASNAIELIYAIFKDTNLTPEERLDVLNNFLLLSIENCHDVVALDKFYSDNLQNLHDLILEEMNDSEVVLRKHSLITKVACYRLFEIMYGKIPANIILSYRVQHANIEDSIEYLNIFLLRYSHEVRSFTAKFDEEKDIARLLHCSALNSYIAILSLQVGNAFQNMIFKEESLKNQLLWERIIDCERKYEFQVSSSSQIKIVNVFRKHGDGIRLSLEKDELNDHECMRMIVAYFLHAHDTKPVLARDTLPDWMLHFHEAFSTDKNNVILFLLRVILNARRAFLPWVYLFFESIAKVTCSYLRENKINYLVRDVMLMIIESNYELKSESEIKAGQRLIEALVQQAQDPNVFICEYNTEMIEKLLILWNLVLQVPANLSTLIESDQALAIRIILVFLKNNVHREEIAYMDEVQKVVKNRMFRWREPLTPQIIEILGYMLSCLPKEEIDRTVIRSLLPMFREMKRVGSADFCARMFYLMFRCYPSLAKHKELLQFINPVDLKNDECKAECFEMCIESMMDLDPSVISSKLESMQFMELLDEKTLLPCVEVGFKIIDKLVLVFNAQQLLPYARVVEKYASEDELLEHKSNAIWFFIGVYKKYINVSPEESDEHTNNLIALSEQVLINGVSDPLDVMQEDVLDFWRDDTQLAETTDDRLKCILEMFSLEVHSSYAQFLCLLMLDLTNKYSDNQKLLFGPLTPCNFENQEVVIPRKSRSRAPVQRAGPRQKPNSPMNVDDSARRRIDDGDLKRSRRTFPANEEMNDRAFLCPIVTRNYAEEYEEKLRAQKLEEEKNIMKFNRSYKETYLPDVEINQADVVITIEDYARRCPSYAADLSVSIVCGILDHFKGRETYNEILTSLANMCKKALKEANEFAPTAMEILYKTECSFDIDDVLKIAKSMGLESLAILILEKKSICYDYVDIYRPGKKFTKELPLNVHLAMLYRSIDEPDVVESIFKNWKLDATLDYLREGSTAEAEMDWSNAKDAYEEGFKSASGVVKDYCMEGMFECLSKLASWSEINETIDTIVNDNDYNSIWQHPNKEQLLPWIFKAQLQERLENLVCDRNSESEFSNHLAAWLDEKGDSITRSFGEELSLFFLCDGDSTTARKCLDSVLQNMNGKSDQRALNKFKRMKEIEMYLKVVDNDPIDGTKLLIKLWEKNVPEFGDDMLNWIIQINYRLTFANLLSNWLHDVSMDSGITSDLVEASLKQRFIINDLALKYKNILVARKYSMQIKKDLNNTDQDDERFQKLRQQFKLDSCRYAYLHSEIEIDTNKRFSYFVSSWHGAVHELLNKNLDLSLKVKNCHHIFDITQALRSWILTDESAAYRVMEDEDFISGELNAESPEELDQLLFNYSFNTMKDIYGEGNVKDKAESYAKFAEYCQKLLIDVYDRDNALHREFLFSLLQAMSFGSEKAARYFPCLLNHSIYRDNESLSKLFLDRCQTVPSRLFLAWQEEIISHLATPLAPQVLPIVKKLCNDYPSAIIYALRKVRANPVADELYNSTFTDSKYDTFFCAMEYLCQPEEYLRHRLQDFINSLNNNETISDATKVMLNKIASNATLQSAAFKRVFTNYRKEFEKLVSISDVAVARKTAEQLCVALRKTMAQRIEKTDLTELIKLSYYSPFLNEFIEKDFNVDVPTQYNALHQRPKIARIDRFVRALPSKSNSLAIKMVGSDGRTYEFFVKCGVDLQQDQKMQRIFQIANQSMKHDLNCLKRHLSVRTYSLIPISTSTGLVQRVPNVKSLEEIVELPLIDKSIIQTTKEKYQKWLNAASEDETPNESLAYRRTLAKYSAENVSQKMIELSAGIKPNLIQQCFLQISPSLDSYFKLRQNFIKNYATMCLTHWLFGVGDRRLKNILVDVFNGDCFGINFALTFGDSAELPIPELVPFRLTAQIVNLMKPFGERDLFGATMCHVLKALKNDKNLVIGCLNGFLEEPINWNAKLNLLWKSVDATHNGVEWSSAKKIEILKQKLRGSKPSRILTNELSYMQSDAENRYFSLYELIVNGNERFYTTARSLIKDHELTPEEQVLCLLDQATDVNIIGRMCADWKCFL